MARSSLPRFGLRSRMAITWVVIVALAGVVLFVLLRWGERQQRAAEEGLSNYGIHRSK